MGTIRRATSNDQQYLGELAAKAFAVYGNDYGLMIPAYARDARVITLLYEENHQPVGFIQVGSSRRPGTAGTSSPTSWPWPWRPVTRPAAVALRCFTGSLSYCAPCASGAR